MTDYEQDELAALDELPEEPTDLAFPSFERVFYNKDNLNDHEITHITYKDVRQDIKNLKEDFLSSVKEEIIDTIVN